MRSQVSSPSDDQSQRARIQQTHFRKDSLKSIPTIEMNIRKLNRSVVRLAVHRSEHGLSCSVTNGRKARPACTSKPFSNRVRDGRWICPTLEISRRQHADASLRSALVQQAVLGITLVTFLTLHVLPADPARLLAGPGAPETQILAIRHDLGVIAETGLDEAIRRTAIWNGWGT